MHKSRDTDIDIMDFTKSGSDICRRQKKQYRAIETTWSETNIAAFSVIALLLAHNVQFAVR